MARVIAGTEVSERLGEGTLLPLDTRFDAVPQR